MHFHHPGTTQDSCSDNGQVLDHVCPPLPPPDNGKVPVQGVGEWGCLCYQMKFYSTTFPVPRHEKSQKIP